MHAPTNAIEIEIEEEEKVNKSYNMIDKSAGIGATPLLTKSRVLATTFSDQHLHFTFSAFFLFFFLSLVRCFQHLYPRLIITI